MAGSSREYKMYIKIAGEIDKSLPESARLSKAELRAIAREASAASATTATSFRQGLQETKPMFDKVGRTAKRAFKTVTVAATAASVAVGSFAVKTGMEYESQMSTVEALSQASEAKMLQLDKTAKNLGATTVWTAKESGQAMEYMAMAGWNAKQMVDAVPATMDLASASGEELATVSDIVTDSMTAFSLKAEQAGHFTDVLAAAATSSNTNVGKLGESFKYAAPLAGSMGYTIEDTAFSLGLMANNGIKASQAGTSMRSWLTRMAKPTNESGAAMKKLGLSLEDSHGKMKPLRTMIDETRKSFQGLSKSQKAEYAAMLAGKTGMSGLLAIVNSTDKDYKKLRQSIDECNGAAKEMADTKLDNLEGDVTLFKSALDGAGMEIYEEMKEPLREIVSSGTKWVGEFAKNFKTNFPTIRRYVSEAGEAFGKLASPLLTVGGWMMDHPDVIVGTITGIGTALMTYKVVSGISNLSTSLASLSVGGKAVIGVTAVTGIVTGIAGAIAEADEVAKDASLDKHFGNISLSMEDIQSISKEIVGAKKLERVSELLDSMSKSQGLADELKDANQTIKKMNWKVSAGMELSDNDTADYESSVRQYISSAQDLIDQKGYEVSISTSLLFEDSPEKTQLLKNNNYFYNELDGEISDLSAKIEKKLQKGLKDGFSPDLQNEVDSLINQMSEITNALTEAESEASWDFIETRWSGKDLDASSFKNLKKEIQDNIKDVNEGAESAYKEGVTNAKAKKKLGYINEKQYKDEVEKYKTAYEDTIGETKERGYTFLYNSFMDTYAQDIRDGKVDSDSAISEMLNGLDELAPSDADKQIINTLRTGSDYSVFERIADFASGFGTKNTGASKFSDKNRGAKDIANNYLNGDVESGKEKNLTANDWMSIGNSMFGGKGNKNSKIVVDPKVEIKSDTNQTKKFANDLNNELQKSVSSSSIDITVDPNIILSPSAFSKTIYGDKKSNKGKVEKHAKGGIFSTPHLGMVAEAGYSEAIIPIDGSANAYNLLAQTAQMLGVGDGLSSLAAQVIVLSNGGAGTAGAPAGKQSPQPITVHYSPKITIQGDADRSMVESVLSDDYEKFKRFMDRWKKESGRVSLA